MEMGLPNQGVSDRSRRLESDGNPAQLPTSLISECVTPVIEASTSVVTLSPQPQKARMCREGWQQVGWSKNETGEGCIAG